MAPITLYDSFSGVPDSDSPACATELLKTLIQIVGHHVSEFKRNTLSAYRIVQRSCDLYNKINELIEQVETDPGWDSYDQYTKAIGPLEKILFEIADITERECVLWLPENDDISDCVDFINCWARARRQLREFSDRLHTLNAFAILSTDSESADLLQRHDDSNLISALCRDIGAHSCTDDPAISEGRISSVKVTSTTIPSKISKEVKDDSIVMAVKCMMLIHGIMQVSVMASDSDLKLKLAAASLWKKAQKLLTNLSDHLENGTPDVASLQQEWEDLIKFLEEQDVPVGEIPSKYYELRQLARSVRRPYHSRTLVLISHCRLIVEKFKEYKSVSNLRPLISAIEAAKQALDDAIAATGPMDAIELYTVDIETSEVAKAFNEAEAMIHECFKKYQIGGWNERAAEMDAALFNDKLRVGQMNTRFEEYKKVAAQSSEADSFEVTVKTSGSSETYVTKGSTPLRAIF